VGKTFARYFKFDLNRINKGISIYYYHKSPIITIFPDDTFRIHDIRKFKETFERITPQSFLPYGILIESKIDGLYINTTFIGELNSIMMTKNGKILSHLPKRTHNKENRKTFNKYMLNWQKNLQITIRMNNPEMEHCPVPYLYSLRKFYNLSPRELYEFTTQIPTANMVSWIVDLTSEYAASNLYNDEPQTVKYNAIKSIRRSIDKRMYPAFLRGEIPEIGKLSK
jgi:hypothetical protein